MTLTEQCFSELENILNQKCENAKVPGMALVIAKNGKPIFEKYYGYRDVEKQLPVTSDTIFGVASLTKSFAALAIMQLEDRGKLSVDDPVVKWLPAFTLPNKEHQGNVTIHHLLTHTSGLPGMAAVNSVRANSIKNDPDGEYLHGKMPENSAENPVKTVEDMLHLMAEMNYTSLGAPGEAFNYSNESFAMLQAIIERASETPFIAYAKKHIFKPLQMERSTFLFDELQKMDNVTELYAYKKDGSKAVFHSPVWWDVGDIYTNGSLKASVMDIMKYLEVYRQGGHVHGEQIVSEASVQKMTSSHVITPNEAEYGYGLQIRNNSGVKIVGHGGSIKGVSAHMATTKEYSVAVLINLAEVDAEGIAMTALHHVLGIHDPEESITAEYDVTADQLAKYVGHYESDEGQMLEVSIKEDQLQVGVKQNQMIINAYSKDSFITPDGKKVKFIVNNQDEVIGIFSGLRFIPRKRDK